MNILFCSVGRRGELVKDFKKSMNGIGKIVAVDNSSIAPAMYLADKQYLVPLINDGSYIERLLEICKIEEIHAIATFIDPEIEVLSKNRERFEEIGITVLVPYLSSAKVCFDKYEFYKYMKKNHINTILTFDNIEEFKVARSKKNIDFPVFVKPKSGSGSVGARKLSTLEELESIMSTNASLIIQEYMDGVDLDADVYVDTISREVVSIFSKKKLETKIGGASKTISFKDKKLFDIVEKVVSLLELFGPNDMDFFYVDGEYYISEINPRFGGAYLHAFGAGVDFIKLIDNNVQGIENKKMIGDYDEDIIMMMYDSVVVMKKEEILKIDSINNSE